MKPKKIVLSGDTAFNSATRNNSEIAFDLYLKNREVMQINSSLRKILYWEKSKREVWLDDNEEVIDQLLDAFMQDSTMLLDGVKLQGESLQLSVELMTNLREAVTVIKSLVKGKDALAN